MSDCRFADATGAWVLGALDDDEAHAFAAHLETCTDCRCEVAELRVPAGLLGLGAPQVTPSPQLRERIMATVRAEASLLAAAGAEADRVPVAAAPARRRWWTGRGALGAGAGALAVAACAAVVAIVVAGGGGNDRTRTLTGSGNRGATIEVRVDDGGHAVLRLSRLPAPPSGRVYEAWIVRHGTARPTHALFGVRPDGEAQVEIPEKVSGAERLMVTDEPAGGSAVPSGRVVANADLA